MHKEVGKTILLQDENVVGEFFFNYFENSLNKQRTAEVTKVKIISTVKQYVGNSSFVQLKRAITKYIAGSKSNKYGWS